MSQIFFEGKEFDGFSLGKIWADGCRLLANIKGTSTILAVYIFPDWAELGRRYLECRLGRRHLWI